jgi:hypothetical protein
MHSALCFFRIAVIDRAINSSPTPPSYRQRCLLEQVSASNPSRGHASCRTSYSRHQNKRDRITLSPSLLVLGDIMSAFADASPGRLVAGELS